MALWTFPLALGFGFEESAPYASIYRKRREYARATAAACSLSQQARLGEPTTTGYLAAVNKNSTGLRGIFAQLNKMREEVKK